ncbi:MAG: substrate-binding domain-containing protein [Verrucomicrobia bacterium]|nr:substrate-binding domain-containing protein [Verrucomicrobiota bacterium]
MGILTLNQGCDKNNTSTSGGATNSPAVKKLKLAFVTNTKNDFWATVRHGCDSAALNLGNVDVDFRFFTGSTVEEQQQILNDLVAGGVDGIAISPIDAGKQKAGLDQIAAKTLLVCVDSDVPDSKRVCFIGSDNVAAGAQAADLLKAALPKGGKVILFVGFPNAQNAKDRIQGLQDALAGSDIQIIDTMGDETKPDVAEKNAQDALAKHPDLAGMVGLYSYDGPAILAGARAAGKAGQVKIVCFDDDTATLDGLAAGDISGTVVQISTRIGAETMTRMDRYLGGDKSQLSAGKILFKSLPIDKTKVELIRAWQQDMLQP